MCHDAPSPSVGAMLYNDRISPLRVAAVVAATAIAALALPPVSAHAADKTKTLPFFSKQVSLTVTKAEGHVIARPPYPQMKPGDVLDVLALDFAGDHLHHAAR